MLFCIRTLRTCSTKYRDENEKDIENTKETFNRFDYLHHFIRDARKRFYKVHRSTNVGTTRDCIGTPYNENTKS